MSSVVELGIVGSVQRGALTTATETTGLIAAVPVGAIVLAEIGFQRNVSTDTISGVTDSKGNTWVEVRTLQQRSSSAYHAMWMTTITNAFVIGDTVTVTYSAAANRNGHVLVLDAFTNAAWTGETTGNPAGSSGAANDQRYSVASSRHAVGGLFFVEIAYTFNGGSDAITLAEPGTTNLFLQKNPSTTQSLRVMHKPNASAGELMGFLQPSGILNTYTGGTIVLAPLDYVEPTPVASSSRLSVARGVLARGSAEVVQDSTSRPYIRDSATGTSFAAGTGNCPRPTLTQVGDLLVAVVGSRTTDATDPGATPPAGWTTYSSVRRNANSWLTVYTKTAAVDDPASWDFTYTQGGSLGILITIFAVANTTGLETASTPSSTNSVVNSIATPNYVPDVPGQAVNYLINPSLEVDLSYTGLNGAASYARVTTDSFSGSACARMICTAVDDGLAFNGIDPSGMALITGSGQITLSCYVKGEAGKLVRLYSSERGSSGRFLRDVPSPTLTCDGTWQRISFTYAMTGDQVGIRLKIVNATAGAHTFLADAALLTIGSTLYDYFDGDVAGSAWTAGRLASSSIRISPAPRTMLMRIAHTAVSSASPIGWTWQGARAHKVGDYSLVAAGYTMSHGVATYYTENADQALDATLGVPGTALVAMTLAFKPVAIASPPPTDMTIWWKLDDGSGATATDSSGNAHHAVLGSGASWISGRIGASALRFDKSVNGYISGPDLDYGVTYSFAMWIWVRDTSPNGDGIIMGESPGGYAFYYDDTNIYHSAGSGNYCYVAHGGLTSGWNHIAVTRDASGANVKFYKNGVQLGATQVINVPTNTLRVQQVGSYSDGTFPGQFDADDIRSFVRELSPTEVSTIYNYTG